MTKNYKKLSEDEVWTKNDLLMLKFKKEFETVTGLDFIQYLFHFAQTYYWKDDFWKDENGQRCVMKGENKNASN